MYIAILRRLMVPVRRKKLEKFKTNSWFLRHDTVPAHRSLLIKYFVTKCNVTAQEYSPYYFDLSPSDFTCFLTEISTEGALLLWTLLRMQRRSWKGFYKMASRNFSSTFTGASRIVWLHKGTVLKEMWLEWLYWFVFPPPQKKKSILGTLWSYHIVICRGNNISAVCNMTPCRLTNRCHRLERTSSLHLQAGRRIIDSYYSAYKSTQCHTP